MFQIAKGCEHLYNKGIFHRDIKTENILISSKSNLTLYRRYSQDI